MCTLLVALNAWEGARLVVAANRDERLSRPATGPRLWPEPNPFFAPRDEVGGGSWIGVNERGLFVGVTNRSIGGGPSLIAADRRSRGALVLDALRSGSVQEASQIARSHGPEAHNPFHLVLVDADRAAVLVGDGWSLREETLSPGAVHIVTERSYGAASTGREELLRERLAGLQGEPEPSPERWRRLLMARRPHDEDDVAAAFDDVCVSVPRFDYGTRSSTWLRVGEALRWASIEGPPGSGPFVELSEQIPWAQASDPKTGGRP